MKNFKFLFFLFFLVSYAQVPFDKEFGINKSINVNQLEKSLGFNLISSNEWDLNRTNKIEYINGKLLDKYIIFKSITKSNSYEYFAYDTITNSLKIITDFASFIKKEIDTKNFYYKSAQTLLIKSDRDYLIVGNKIPRIINNKIICYTEIIDRKSIYKSFIMLYELKGDEFKLLNRFTYDSCGIYGFKYIGNKVHMYLRKEISKFRWGYLCDFIIPDAPGPWERIYLTDKLDYELNDSLNIFELKDNNVK